MHPQKSSVKRQPFGTGLNVLEIDQKRNLIVIECCFSIIFTISTKQQAFKAYSCYCMLSQALYTDALHHYNHWDIHRNANHFTNITQVKYSFVETPCILTKKSSTLHIPN